MSILGTAVIPNLRQRVRDLLFSSHSSLITRHCPFLATSHSSLATAFFPDRRSKPSNHSAVSDTSFTSSASFTSSIFRAFESQVREASPADSADAAPPPPPSATRSNDALRVSSANTQSQTAAWPRENPLRPKTIRLPPSSSRRPRRGTREFPPANPPK